MKKTIYAFAAFLIGVFVLLSLWGRHDDYIVERRLWQTGKQLRLALKSPVSLPDKAFEDLADRYRKIINDFPRSGVLPEAYFSLANVYTAQKDYPRARKVFREIIEKFPAHDLIVADAMSRMAKAYELQNNWPQALAEYEKIITDYPTTDIGLLLPLYLANHYKTQNNIPKARETYGRAVSIYRDILKKEPDKRIRFKTLKLMADTYFAQEKWREGLETLGEILMNYPVKDIIIPTVNTINQVALSELKNPEAAVILYQKFIKTYPDSPFNKQLEKLVNILKKWDEKALFPDKTQRPPKTLKTGQ